MLINFAVNDIDIEGGDQGDGTHGQLWVVEDDPRSPQGGQEEVWVTPLMLTEAVNTLLGDFDDSGVLDLPDVNMLNTQIDAATNDGAFDLNADNLVNDADLTIWVKDLRKTWYGDANLDGEFTSGDLVTVLAAGKFQLEEEAGWQEGDWDADLRFTTGDLVKGFADGGFGAGPLPAATAAVPEPSSFLILTVLSLGLMLYRRSWA